MQRDGSEVENKSTLSTRNNNYAEHIESSINYFVKAKTILDLYLNDNIINENAQQLLSKKILHEELVKPSKDIITNTTIETEQFINSLVQKKKKNNQLARTKIALDTPDLLITYEANKEILGYNPQKNYRALRIRESAVDPIDPTYKELTNEIVRKPIEEISILHKNNHKLTKAEKAEWEIPKSISNWKNPKGDIIPLSVRIPLSTNNEMQVTASNTFAKFAEVLGKAEETARAVMKAESYMMKKENIEEEIEREKIIEKMMNDDNYVSPKKNNINKDYSINKAMSSEELEFSISNTSTKTYMEINTEAETNSMVVDDKIKDVSTNKTISIDQHTLSYNSDTKNKNSSPINQTLIDEDSGNKENTEKNCSSLVTENENELFSVEGSNSVDLIKTVENNAANNENTIANDSSELATTGKITALRGIQLKLINNSKIGISDEEKNEKTEKKASTITKDKLKTKDKRDKSYIKNSRIDSHYKQNVNETEEDVAKKAFYEELKRFERKRDYEVLRKQRKKLALLRNKKKTKYTRNYLESQLLQNDDNLATILIADSKVHNKDNKNESESSNDS